jgi:hypothetical protein
MRNLSNLRLSLGAAGRCRAGTRTDESIGAPPSHLPRGEVIGKGNPHVVGPGPQGRAQAVAVGPSLGELGDT